MRASQQRFDKSTVPSMQIEITGKPKIGCPPFKGDLDRITVLLGANGAGKSKLISAIAVSVANRIGEHNVLRFTPNIGPTNVQLGAPKPVRDTLTEYENQKKQSIRNPVNAGETNLNTTLQLLASRDAEMKDELWEEVRKFQSGESETIKSLKKTHIEKTIETFNDIFEIDISFDSKTSEILCKAEHNPDSYKFGSASTGETWGLRIIPELVLREDDEVVVIVDEPESRLNEQLVSRFWSNIESRNPKWRFIYATHNPSFAARPNVDQVFLLKSPKNEPVLISDLNEIPGDERRKLFGVAPLLVTSHKTLFVEGVDNSFDKLIYKALLDDEGVDVQTINSCNDVVKATTHTGYWKYLPFDNVFVRGVIDRDYRTDAENDSLVAKAPGNLYCLKRHDIEAYLADPVLLSKIAQFISGPEKDESFYQAKIVDYAKDHFSNTLRSLSNQAFRLSHQLSVSKSDKDGASLDGISAAELAALYKSQRNNLLNQLNLVVSDTEIENTVTYVSDTLNSIIDTQDVESILKYYKGKPILQQLLRASGVQDKEHAVRVARNEGLFALTPKLAELRKDLLTLISD